MKNIYLTLCAIIFASIAHSQSIKHAPGVKSIGLFFTPTTAGYLLQPRFGYYLHKRVMVGGSLYFENYSPKNSRVSTFLVKPHIDYSIVKISNFLYVNLSAGLNLGNQMVTTKTYTINQAQSVITIADKELSTGFVIGTHIGINADLFIYKGIAINGGFEYVSVPKRLIDENKFRLKLGLVYNFKFF